MVVLELETNGLWGAFCWLVLFTLGGFKEGDEDSSKDAADEVLIGIKEADCKAVKKKRGMWIKRREKIRA